jgi:DNA-directed RNA polymerase specialized sigma24 family protein
VGTSVRGFYSPKSPEKGKGKDSHDTSGLARGQMSFSEEHHQAAAAGARRFATTHWSVVLRAGDTQAPESRVALETLCSVYWHPLYAFVRGGGYAPDEARDLTQEFFARLLEKKWLKDADPERGRFRTFLLAALKHFLANEWKAAHRQKRGGDAAFVSVEELEEAERYEPELADRESAEKAYDRRWAEAVLARVLERLRSEWNASGHGARYEALKSFLAEDDGPAYAELSRQLGLSENGIATSIHRLRRRYGELFRAEIAETVSEPTEVEGEIRYLCGLLAGG